MLFFLIDSDRLKDYYKCNNHLDLMKKKTLSVVLIIIIAVIAILFVTNRVNDNDGDSSAILVSCLADRGVLVYGSSTCPACADFANQFGGYDVIAPIYVECMDEQERCSQEMQTFYVPEIQIDGKLYEGPRTPQILGEFVGCEI